MEIYKIKYSFFAIQITFECATKKLYLVKQSIIITKPPRKAWEQLNKCLKLI